MQKWIVIAFAIALLFQNCGPGFKASRHNPSDSAAPQEEPGDDTDLDTTSNLKVSFLQEKTTLFLKLEISEAEVLQIPVRSDCRTQKCGTLSSYEMLNATTNLKKQLVSVLYETEPPNEGSKNGAGFLIADIENKKITAHFLNPDITVPELVVLFPKGSQGLKYPVLTSGYTQFSSQPTDTSQWGSYICIYRPSSSDPGCGTGFGKWDIRPSGTNGYAKHAGGLVYDFDGDGWDDIYLPFFRLLMIVSGYSGQVIKQLNVDYAAANGNYSNSPYSNLPFDFHSGRSYGIHSLRNTQGWVNGIIIGGNPVGTFGQYSAQGDYTHSSDGFVTMCDVSRFVAMVTANDKNPSSFHLQWSRYMSFYQPIFASNADRSQSNAPTPIKNSDMVDRCIHHFSNGRVRAIEGGELVGFNMFAASELVDNCVQAYWDYQRGTQEPFYLCLTKNIETQGRWTSKFLWALDGMDLLLLDSTYTWGVVPDFIEKGQMYLIIEPMAASVGFNVANSKPGTLKVYQASSAGEWHLVEKGIFPFEGRPEIRYTRKTSDPGDADTGFGFALLTTEDRDQDGLLELKLSDGKWIGYSQEKKAFVEK